ncbi:MAG: restriction endonuclease subunit S [Dysgonomonas sp.]|uniref:restriction endonuclease subunit S n=1 Tax=Dysgonomonas sp. GY75 TaxID=2780419 RepID=UPI00188406D0|nr:restriction endonuclease subunit S [Dysgonomonas sp. GY75]MBF0650084.1 restriction endonuclease subunit S [Dysgonomonas sp. GY75]
MKENKNIPVGYKDSPVGVIPKDWEIYDLRSVATFINGRAYKQEELLEEGKYKVLRVGNFFTNDKWYYSNLELPEDKYADFGDLLYAWSASFGPQFWFDNKIIYHYHIWKIVPSNIITKQYLFHFLDFDAHRLKTKIQGGTMAHITKSEMEDRKIYLPLVPEQKKIAEILSIWDNAIEVQSKLVDKLKLRKQALMQQLLTGKRRLKGFDKEWKEYRLGEIFERVTRKNNSGNTNIVTISAQRGFVKQNDFFKKTVASEMLDNYFLIYKGEFCYNKSYSNGYPMGATKRLTNFNSAVVTTLYICFKLIGDQYYSGDFFEHFFEANLLNKGLLKIAHEGGRAHGLLNVTPNDFFNIHIKIPLFEEQTAMANILSTADKEIEIANVKLDKLREQKKGLMQQLLTGKKRVKLN